MTPPCPHRILELHDGAHWCRQHDPSAVAAREAARGLRHSAEVARAAADAERAAADVLAAAWALARDGPDLAAIRDEVESLVAVYAAVWRKRGGARG